MACRSTLVCMPSRQEDLHRRRLTVKMPRIRGNSEPKGYASGLGVDWIHYPFIAVERGDREGAPERRADVSHPGGAGAGGKCSHPPGFSGIWHLADGGNLR